MKYKNLKGYENVTPLQQDAINAIEETASLQGAAKLMGRSVGSIRDRYRLVAKRVTLPDNVVDFITENSGEAKGDVCTMVNKEFGLVLIPLFFPHNEATKKLTFPTQRDVFLEYYDVFVGTVGACVMEYNLMRAEKGLEPISYSYAQVMLYGE